MSSANAMLRPLLNREFKLPADGLFQFVPKGEFPIVHEGRRILQVIDDEALAAIAGDLRNRVGARGWDGLLVDFDHHSSDMDKSSAAAGWAAETAAPVVRAGDDAGLWGAIRWSNTGKAAVEGGDFRYLSPEFDAATALHLGGGRYRIMRLDGLAVTNKPNMRGIRALFNRSASDRPNNQPTTTMLNRLLTLLGLPAATTEDQALDAVTQLKNRAAPADALKDTHVPKAEHETLKNRLAKLLDGQVEATLEKFKNRFAADKLDLWKSRLKADFEGTVELLESLPEAADTAAERQPLHNRGTAKPPAGSPGKEDAKSKAANERAAKIKNRALTLQHERRLSWREAWSAAESEFPE